MSTGPDMADRVAVLARAFQAKLPARLDSIEAAFAARDWVELHRLLHSLGGAAGTFGMAELGLAARHIEAMIAPNPAPIEDIGAALEALRVQALAPPG